MNFDMENSTVRPDKNNQVIQSPTSSDEVTKTVKEQVYHYELLSKRCTEPDLNKENRNPVRKVNLAFASGNANEACINLPAIDISESTPLSIDNTIIPDKVDELNSYFKESVKVIDLNISEKDFDNSTFVSSLNSDSSLDSENLTHVSPINSTNSLVNSEEASGTVSMVETSSDLDPSEKDSDHLTRVSSIDSAKFDVNTKEASETVSLSKTSGDCGLNVSKSSTLPDVQFLNNLIDGQDCVANKIEEIVQVLSYLSCYSNEHIISGLSKIESGMIRYSLEEKKKYKDESSEAIEGLLTISNMCLSLKKDYVFIDYDCLKDSNRCQDLKKVNTVYHMVFFARSSSDSIILPSNVCTVVLRSEANKHHLPCINNTWFEMFEKISYHHLRPRFKIFFEVYYMEIDPKLTETNTLAFFINLSSIVVTPHNLPMRKREMETKFRVINSCPFSGLVKYATEFKLKCVNQYRDTLEVYDEDGDSYMYECELFPTAICLWDLSDLSGAPLIVVSLFNSYAVICDDPKQFLVHLNDKDASGEALPVSRFLAEAASPEEAVGWCSEVNHISHSFYAWSHVIAHGFCEEH